MYARAAQSSSLILVTTTAGPLITVPHDKHEIAITQYFQTDPPPSDQTQTS